MLPFRCPWTPRETHIATERGSDYDLLVVLGLFWALSLVRVSGAMLRHEVFGTEATLALMAIVAIPWLVRGHRTQAHAPQRLICMPSSTTRSGGMPKYWVADRELREMNEKSAFRQRSMGLPPAVKRVSRPRK